MMEQARTCTPLEENMLAHRVSLTHAGGDLTFDLARQLADREASRRGRDPMLLAWYDRHSGRFSPNVECCDETKPAWLVYAESRGADLAVTVNGLDYVFVYRLGEEA
ncbi:hypothetical protein SAMN02746041_01096 [Desulfacinum hydrothermale DSM 13146]|uniref:DUF5619 domain-containing protein n=1 Tax=Desulfacinum hydrothermale DSM 13146 TaxID=1121390 RepID=A0A1W1XAH3_9BACT|nr:AF1514 family protein [Desulfacinum hydrothermale]SMC21025.1 hypothetical protein SAMN02746041_01096 [Desulfacinum hydrothermale DSM 13146]